VATRTKDHIKAEDLYRLQQISGCEISPDGGHVAYSLSRVDRATEKKYASLWVAPARRGAPRQFTYGDQSDTSPKWSPDGRQLAFLSDRGDSKQSQIYLVPSGGGEARLLTDLKGDFGPFEWSPDGRQLVVQFRRKDAEEIEREKDERKKGLGIVARHITRVVYKADGSGFLPKERWHVVIVGARSGRATHLTDGDLYDETEPRWSPDGRHILFMSNRSEDPDFNPDVVDLYVVPVEGGELRKIPTHVGLKGMPSPSPDGRWVAFAGREHRADWSQNDRLWVVPFDGSAAPTNLTKEHDFSVGNSTINDIGGTDTQPPVWSTDGTSIYLQVAHHGSTALKSVSLDGGGLTTVVDGPCVVGGFGFDRTGSRLAYVASDMGDTGQIRVLDLAGGRARELTRVNRGWLGGLDLGEVEEVWFKGAVGNDLQGWIMKPPGFDARKTYPSVLEIHGGPLAQYGHTFMHEFRFLAAQGYVVTFSNPRGGRGYGEEHATSIWNDNGGGDYDDVMAWAEHVAGLPYIDRDRMGVTGGSYGGFMVNWIIGHTDMFRAAVTNRSIFNRTSSYGTSDMNWIRGEAFGDEAPWENVENYLRQSPLTAIGNAKTPTLVIHSENDLRCPIEQGEQLFVALMRLGVDTEMVRFPDESHGLSRGGRTDRRVVRLHHILRWFDKYLRE
jgi:dipeptidyl aminopeptidase/acylaminoacyl peptidase